MGKICPKCSFHMPENTEYWHITSDGCEHDFDIEPGIHVSSNTLEKKWRCKKCLVMKFTYD